MLITQTVQLQFRKKHLIDEMGTSFRLDYQYADLLGFEAEGSWADFSRFLEKTFLPDLIHSLNKPSGAPIVLAVVSHSNFMNEGEVHEACGDLYEQKPKKKARNNQVVKMSYTFTSTIKTGVDATPMRKLERDGSSCAAVIDGASMYDGQGKIHPLCRSDIGRGCWEQIRDQGMESFPHIVEDTLKTMKKRLDHKKWHYKKTKASVSIKMRANREIVDMEKELASLLTKECYSGGFPASPH